MDQEQFKIIPAREEHVLLDAPHPKNIFLEWKMYVLLVFVLGTLYVFGHKLFISPPYNFPIDTVITIKAGETLSASAEYLKGLHVIKSKFFYKSFMVFFGGTKGLMSGDYYLKQSQNSISVARRLSRGLFELENVKVTIPEGLNVKEIADIFAKDSKFKSFNKAEFINLGTPHEGYLFPDTYLFLPNVTAQNIIDVMLENYDKRLSTISAELKSFGRPIGDVIKMASILEEEGRQDETRRVIAGILWKRLDEKMLLQVDASVVYATGKSDGNKLVPEDFKLKSPYNTYMYLGFPPTPISNPGLDAIRAAIEPTKTKYYFYLTDPEGGFYPATTYDAHLVNKAKYLGS